MAVVHAVRIASCSTINRRIGRDSPTGASKKTNGKLEPTPRVEGSFFIDSKSLLWSRDVGTALWLDINDPSLDARFGKQGATWLDLGVEMRT